MVDLTEEEQLQLAMQASLTELTEGADKAAAASSSSSSSRSTAGAAASSSSSAAAPPHAATAAAARPASTRSSARSAGGASGAAEEGAGAGGGEGYESDYSLEWVEDDDGDGPSAPAPRSTRAAQSGKGAAGGSSSRQGSMDSETSSGSLKRPRNLDTAAAGAGASDAAAAGERLAGTRSPAKMARRDSKHDSAHAGAGGSGGGGISLAPPPQASSLPAEFAPPAGAAASSVSRIMLRMPDGSRQQRKFGSGEPVAALFHWAAAVLQRPHPLAAAYGSVLASPDVAGDPAAVTAEAVTLALQRVRVPSAAEGGAAPSAPWDIVRSHAVGGASRSLSGPLPGMFAGCQSFAAGGLLAAQLHVSLDTKEWGAA